MRGGRRRGRRGRRGRERGAAAGKGRGAQIAGRRRARRRSPELVRKPRGPTPPPGPRPPARVRWGLPSLGGVTLTRAISSVRAGRSHGSGRDKDARWLLCGRDVGTERPCDGPEPRCHPESDRGGAHRRGDAQVGGKTR